MKWQRRQRTGELVDKRRASPRVGGMRRGSRNAALGGGGLIAIIAALLFSGVLGGGGSGSPAGGGLDLGGVFDSLGAAPQGEAPTADQVPSAPDPDAQLVEFMNFLIIDIQDTWEAIFADADRQYPSSRLVLFENQLQSGCGFATEQIGPHYCPRDQNIYIDLDFYRDLARQYNAPGDFAQAYVLAHEVGHHVQHVTGIMDQVRQAQQANPSVANDLSVRLELQADCFAGVWGHATYERGALERGDLEEAVSAAEAVGDDRIQERATGMVNPETWTHGSAAQRIRWFNVGFDTGNPDDCDTFSGDI